MKKFFLCFLILFLPLLTACGINELESNAFPLAVGVAPGEDGDFNIYMAYPDLQNTDALENALSADVYWKGNSPDLFAGADQMSENNSKNVDFNHLKVLVLDKEVLESDAYRDQIIAFFQEKKDAAWNTYVLLSDDSLDDLFSDELEIQSSLGIYLADMVEEWTNIRSGAYITVGDLMSQYYNQNETALIPVVSIKEKRPVVRSFEAVQDLDCISDISQSEAYEVMLMQNQLKSFSFSTENGTRVVMNQISVERQMSKEDDAQDRNTTPVMDLHIRATAKIENRLLLSESEKIEVCRQAQQELADKLLSLAKKQQKENSFDVTNSFLLLAGHNRSLWQQYKLNRDDYERELQYQIHVRLTNGEE